MNDIPRTRRLVASPLTVLRIVRPGGIILDITILEKAEPAREPPEALGQVPPERPGVPSLSTRDEFDGELDDLEDLLSSAVQHANRLRARVAIKRVQRSATEVSQDYAERLAEKATFRRLLSDEALDGVRFRWLFEHTTAQLDFKDIDALRKFIDAAIARKEEHPSG
jgi:hypothetical protein